jgi:hypothetical protein
MKASRALLAAALLAGCSQSAPQSAGDALAARENQALAPLKATYKPAITGIDAKGTTLDLFVDADQLDSMDEPVEDQMKAQALQRWKTVWKADHSGQHATLRVRLRNYFGEEVFSESAKV